MEEQGKGYYYGGEEVWGVWDGCLWTTKGWVRVFKAARTGVSVMELGGWFSD